MPPVLARAAGLTIMALVLAPLPLCASAQQAASPSVAVAPTASPLHVFDDAWRAMRETYVDASLSDADWEALRTEFRPRAAAAASDGEVRAVLRDLLARIDRSHFDLIPAELHERLTSGSVSAAEAGDVGLDVTPLDGLVLVRLVEHGSPAALAGIGPGWRIDAIDGVQLGGGVRSGWEAQGGGGFRLWAVATAMLRGVTGTRVQVTVSDLSGAQRDLQLERVPVQGIPVSFGHLPTQFARLVHDVRDVPGGGRAAYVRFNVWMVPLGTAIDEAVHASRDAEGIILDLRNNPGGVLTMLMGVSGHFLASPISLGTVKTRETELSIVANPRVIAPDGSRVAPYAGKLAILVDQTSYSASEIFAAGLQAIGRARVFGSQTPGGALPALLRRLPNGDVLEYAMGDFVTANGDRIEGRGVIPDDIVPLTAEALAGGRDPVLDAALAWIGSKGEPRVPADRK